MMLANEYPLFDAFLYVLNDFPLNEVGLFS